MPSQAVWSKVAVAAQTVLGTAKVVTALTKASPAVATSVAHGVAALSVVLFLVQGMTELNGRVVRLASVTTDTVTLEGVDSSAYGTFSSGTFQVITFGANAATFQDVNSTGGVAADIDVGTIHIDEDRVLPGNKSALKYEFGSLWDVADACLLALVAASDTKTTLAIAITFANGAKIYFLCYPSCTLAPTGSKGQAVVTPVSFSLAGRLSFYAS